MWGRYRAKLSWWRTGCTRCRRGGSWPRLHRIEINAAVRATAGAYAEPTMRSLDAIHLATAELLVASGKPLRAFVTYDKRLAVAAGETALPVVAPG